MSVASATVRRPGWPHPPPRIDLGIASVFVVLVVVEALLGGGPRPLWCWTGCAATRQLLEYGVPTRVVVVLTTFDLDEYVFAALRAGASGFLLKDAPAEKLAAIRVVAGCAIMTGCCSVFAYALAPRDPLGRRLANERRPSDAGTVN